MSLRILLDNMDDYIVGQSPQVLETRGLGPCAGLAVYDARNRIGVLGHFAIPDEAQSRNFAEMMEWIRTNMNPSELEVTLTGISLDTEATNKCDEETLHVLNLYRINRRENLVLAFTNLGIKPGKIRQRFSARDTVTHALFYMSTGKVELAHEPATQVFECYNA